MEIGKTDMKLVKRIFFPQWVEAWDVSFEPKK